MNLPFELKIEIYMFLEWRDIKKIETDESIIMQIIKLHNPGKEIYFRRIYNNIVENKCYSCNHLLSSSYLLNICYYCKYKFNKHDLFPMYCGCCVPLKKERNYETRMCGLCKHYCAFVGIEPYS